MKWQAIYGEKAVETIMTSMRRLEALRGASTALHDRHGAERRRR